MIATEDRARQIALTYYAAWARRDMHGALEHIADDVVCETPTGRVEGILAFADHLSSFFQLLERTQLIAAFGDDTSAVLLHDDQTMPVPSASTATHMIVEGGRIAQMRLISDGHRRGQGTLRSDGV